MRRVSPVRPVEVGSTPREQAGAVAVVTRPESAAALVHPVRRKVLDALKVPGSATTVGERLGLPRQVVNYHVRALERAGLVEQVARRQRRGLEERVVRATAAYYLIAPDALTGRREEQRDVTDRFSASYQVAVAARTIREVAALGELATRGGKRLTTMTVDSEVVLATPEDREAFARDLVAAIADVIARHNTPQAANVRAYRVFAGVHPRYVEEKS
jgi:DNA-binding transcriptional ArsR family regulator